jgi:ribosomal protein S27E
VQSVFSATPEYKPRKPDETVLHRIVRDHLEDFLQEARERSRDGEGMPDFIVQELNKFLTCGSLAGGFARFKCQDCGHERLLAFSCKRRGICPSCAGRRMAEKAAHLVDYVFPVVPVRQWVLSLPFDLRYMMAWDHRLTRRILRAFSRELEKYYRKKAKKRGVARGQGGAVTVIQRAGGALNLNVHFHTASIDGVFEQTSDSDLKFHRVFAPTTEEVKDLAKRVRKRVLRILGRKKISLRDADGIFEDSFSEEHPALAAAASASIHQLVAFGDRAGRNVLRMGVEPDPEEKPVKYKRKRHARIGGFDLHAGPPVPAHDRDRLERLLRYLLRPPIAQGRLKELPDGRIALMMKSRWDDGTTHIVFQPKELIEKLVAIVPHPQTNQLIYHGVLAPHSRLRRQVVAYGRPAAVLDDDLPKEEAETFDEDETRHMAWADLMRRCFGVDVLECPKCFGRMQLIALIEDPAVIKKILEHLNLPSEVPKARPARPPPEQMDRELWDAVDPVYDDPA